MEGSVLWACKNRWFMLENTLNATGGEFSHCLVDSRETGQ